SGRAYRSHRLSTSSQRIVAWHKWAARRRVRQCRWQVISAIVRWLRWWGGGAGPRVNINLIEDRDRAGQVEVNRSDDEEVDADVFVADIRGGGPRAQALQETFNLRRVGS